MADHLYQYYMKSRENRLLISIKSTVTQNLLVQVSRFLREQLEGQSAVRRVFAVFIELAQNILHHSAERGPVDEKGGQQGIGIMEVIEEEGAFVVQSGNLMERADAVRLQDVVHDLANKQRDDLKELYRYCRAECNDREHPGLGLIDVALRCDATLTIKRVSHAENLDFVMIAARIAKGTVDA